MKPRKQVATKFVPPPSQPLAPLEPLRPVDVSPVWQGIPDESRDSVSAQDRSKAFLIRNAPYYVAVTMMALGATIMYSMVAMTSGISMPWAMDRLLVFVTVLSGALSYVHVRTNKHDHDHSRAGIERLRIERGYQVAIAYLEAELKLKQESMKMITRRDDE